MGNGPGSQASYSTAVYKTPYLSFKDAVTLIVNLIQEKMYDGIEVKKAV